MEYKYIYTNPHYYMKNNENKNNIHNEKQQEVEQLYLLK